MERKTKIKSMKNYLTFICATLIVVSTVSLFARAEFIKSDWVHPDELAEKKPVSALELEHREEKIKALEQKKKAEQMEMQKTREDIQSRRKGLLECMKGKGVVLYSVEDCEACKQQKAYFGDDFSMVKYIDCKKAKFTCPLNGINTYPTWYLGSTLGIKKKGVKDLPALARLTGCPF